MAKFQLVLEQDPEPGDVQFLEDRLYDFNVAATGIPDGRALAFFIRGDDRAILAGLSGHTWGGCCEIRQLWVHESLRGQGCGRALLAAAEVEARDRGCRLIVVTTHSFQAPELYRRVGFDLVAAVDDYPEGHQHLLLRKRLEGAR